MGGSLWNGAVARNHKDVSGAFGGEERMNSEADGTVHERAPFRSSPSTTLRRKANGARLCRMDLEVLAASREGLTTHHELIPL